MDMKVTYGTLAGASADMMSGANAIKARLEQMDSELRQLSANWEGEAQEAYRVAKANWTQSMVELEELLRAISRGVDDSNSSYQQMDSANANSFR